MSEQDIISKLIALGGPLLGAVVGGLITSFATRALERQRWRHDKQEKFVSLRRDTLAAALEWIEPMRNAQGRASSLVMAAIQGHIEYEHLLREWPYLLGDLAKKDLSGHLRVVLPDGTYERGLRIVSELDTLRVLGVKHGQEARRMGRPMAGYQECSTKLDAIETQIAQLETDLRKAYKATFE